jgi:hypothetical protein
MIQQITKFLWASITSLSKLFTQLLEVYSIAWKIGERLVGMDKGVYWCGCATMKIKHSNEDKVKFDHNCNWIMFMIIVFLLLYELHLWILVFYSLQVLMFCFLFLHKWIIFIIITNQVLLDGPLSLFFKHKMEVVG